MGPAWQEPRLHSRVRGTGPGTAGKLSGSISTRRAGCPPSRLTLACTHLRQGIVLATRALPSCGKLLGNLNAVTVYCRDVAAVGRGPLRSSESAPAACPLEDSNEFVVILHSGRRGSR